MFSVNKDDAKSSSIQILFETANPSLDKDIVNNKIKRILFKNNGFVFRDQDWNRLKKIAEGNPDEQKVEKKIFVSIFLIKSYLSFYR